MPGPGIQVGEKNPAQSPKPRPRRRLVGLWCLDLLWILGLGAWIFSFDGPDRGFNGGRRHWRLRRGGGCVKSVLEQGGDVALHLLELVELQIRIDNSEQIACHGLLVNENAPAIALNLFLYLQDALALKHDR